MKYDLIIDDHIGVYGFSKAYVKEVLAGLQEQPINVKISSLGGDLAHGLDIRQQFIDHGDVTVYFSGFVASAATIIALGAKRICMSKHAFMLIHKCSNVIDVLGSYNAEQLQTLIDELSANKKENDKIDLVIAQLYAEKCGKSINEIIDMLKKEEWLTAEEALEFGLIDEIVDTPDMTRQNLTSDLAVKFNRIGLPTCGLEVKNDSSVLDKILAAIRSLQLKFAESSANTQPNKPTFAMTSQFENVTNLLEVEALAISDEGIVNITSEQIASVDEHIANLNAMLAERDNTIAERDNSIAELTATIEALNSQPGDTTTEGVVGDETATPENNFNSSISLFNQIKSLI